MRQRALLGGGILIALVVHAVSKGWALLPEMLWICHVASLVLALAIAFDRPRVAAPAFVSHLVGIPVWLVDVFVSTTTFGSLLAHTIPTAAAWIYFRERGFPRESVVPWGLLFLIMIPIARFATPSALNINLAFHSYPALTAVFPMVWMNWAFNVLLYFGVANAAAFIMRRKTPSHTLSRQFAVDHVDESLNREEP